jgi:hypothetical protein
MTVFGPNPNPPAKIPDQGNALLLTTSCTTGWLDWGHGLLWLCPDGLLRISLGLATTIDKSTIWGRREYDDFARENAVGHFSGAEISELLAGSANAWIPWEEVQAAAIHYGVTADRLRVSLPGGQTRRLLWLPDRTVTTVLRMEFEARLGPGLRVDGWRWRPW